MDNDGRFKRPVYLGTVYLIDVSEKRVVEVGHGHFDTVAMNLEAMFQHSTMGEFKNLMIVIETQDGYFSPLMRFSKTFMPMGQSTSNYSMNMCLHWSVAKGVEYFLDNFDAISIQIKAKHEPTTRTYREAKDKSEVSEEVVIKSVRKDLSAASYKQFTITANSGFSTSFSHDRVDDEVITRRRIRFKITNNFGNVFTFNDLFRTLQAFKMYWIINHDLIDCEITAVNLGNDISLVLADKKLSAVAKNVEGYNSAISVDTPLQLEDFVRLVHFYFNPDTIKSLGPSSKVGLALNRLIGRRFEPKHKKIDYDIADLVFALQSFAEATAQKEISRQNRASKVATLEGISKVLEAIKLIEADLPENVKNFYTKERSVIYTAISRPTFAQSLTITAEKLSVDLAPYEDILTDIEKARQQIVHSESYNSDFLIDLLTQGKTTIETSKDGTTISMAFGIKRGALDRLYDLLVELIKKYIETYNS